MELTGPDCKLLIRPPLIRGESLRGYLLRCAEANLYDSSDWILSLARTKSPWSLPGNLRHVANLLGQSEQALGALTYWTPKGQASGVVSFRGHIINRYHIEWTHARVCPICLKDHQFCRMEWDIRSAVVCPHHGINLIDRCPSCSHPIQWKRKSIDTCKCGAKFWQGDTCSADSASVDLIGCVYRAAEAGGRFVNSSIPPDVRSLPLVELLELIHLLPSYSLRSGTIARTQLGSNSLELLNIVLRESAAILQDWPTGFYALLDQMRGSYSGQEGESGSIISDFGPFYSAMSRRFSASGLRILKKAFATYVDEYWSGGYVTSRNKWVKSTSRSRFLTRVQAGRTLGVVPQTVDVLLKQGELEGKIGSWGSKTFALIERNSITAYKARQRNIVTSRTAAGLLGVSKPAYRAMVDERLLAPHKRIAPRIKKRYEIDHKSIRRLLSRLERSIEHNASVKGISYDQALLRLRGHGYTPSQLVRFALSGHVALVGVNQSGVGLRRFKFSGVDVEKLTEIGERRPFLVKPAIMDFACGGGAIVSSPACVDSTRH